MHITLSGPQPSSHRCIVLLALASCACLNAQQSGKAPPVTTVAQVLALSADPKARIDWVQVGRVMKALPPSERKSLYRQLVAGAHTELASNAARGVINEGDIDSAALIASHISTWPSAGSILQTLASAGRGPYMEIPRAIVRNAIKAAKPVPQPDSATETVGMAAILLAKTGDPADRKMLLDLAQLLPRSWGVWMAIAHAGAIDITRAGLASPVYKDSTAPIAVRVASASALEPLDSQAGAFAVTQVQLFLTRFADQGANQIYRGADAQPGDYARQGFADFRGNFHLLGALLVLKNNTAQQLTFQYLNARNELIRSLCAIVAALRWPDQFVKAGQGSFPDREYADLLAVVALNHPEQANAAALRIWADRMAIAKSHVSTVGLGVFGLPGTMLKIF